MASLCSAKKRFAVLAHGGIFTALFYETCFGGPGEGLSILAHCFGSASLGGGAADSKRGNQERQAGDLTAPFSYWTSSG